MPRKARNYSNTSFFHVIVQGINKEYIFYKKEYINEYIKLFKKYSKFSEIYVVSYCIMSNHAHFLIYTNKIYELSNFMQKLNMSYAKYYNKVNNRVGYVFRDRFLSEPITSERYLVTCIKYIHKNPVKAKIVSEEINYNYSSYKEFLSNEKFAEIEKITGINIKNRYLYSCYEDILFKDVEKNNIIEGIEKFINLYFIETYKIFEDVTIFKELILFLKKECSIQYKEMISFFGISIYFIKKIKKS